MIDFVRADCLDKLRKSGNDDFDDDVVLLCEKLKSFGFYLHMKQPATLAKKYFCTVKNNVYSVFLTDSISPVV